MSPQIAQLFGNRSLRCSTSCIHAVVRILRPRHSHIHVHHANERKYFFVGCQNSTLGAAHPPILNGGCVSLIRPTTLNFKFFTAFHLRSFAFICGLFFSFIAQPSFADTTQPTIRDLDRLFTTRFERAQLDALRARMSGAAGTEIPTTESQATTSPLNVEMQGIMQREKGKTVTWINGQSTLKSNTIDDNIRVKGQPKALSGANISIGGQTVRLKPGQVWQQENGQVVESYKTKVAAPVTKGADEPVADVQTEKVAKEAPKPAAAKPEVLQPKP